MMVIVKGIIIISPFCLLFIVYGEKNFDECLENETHKLIKLESSFFNL